MTDLIEKVAREFTRGVIVASDWDVLGEEEKKFLLDAARAAIEAVFAHLEQPSDETLKQTFLIDGDAKEVFCAMLAQAKREALP